ncbi:cytochrome P450 [Skermania sp. ID1734]|uniref:cytochrome P450 n=1 Tax=Skermania sp. ID1734 TaxID=2597516 RepID=UPI00117DB182|nr:cytochrome P450 [Skermania sp. ID1734]TSD94449.1 cytochrome P450 [Skermania sp. ID1734]
MNLTRSIQAKAAALTELYPAKVKPLADPPPDSGLLPVMGDGGAPLVGHTFEGLRDVLALGRQLYGRYGEVSWTSSFGHTMVAAIGPAAVEEVWANRNKAFSSELGWEYFLGPFFRRGLMLLDFDEHLYHRRIMQQAFTRPRLIGYLDMMTPLISRELDDWRPSGHFHVYHHAKQMLLNLATEVFVGEHLGPEARKLERAFEDTVRGGQAFVRASIPGGTWSRGLSGRKYLQRYFRSHIAAKRAGDGQDLFSVLSRAQTTEGHRFTDEDVVNHMIFVLMAAHDTSTLALSMLTYLLGRNREWQDRLRAESVALGKPTLTYDDLDKLPALDMAFKETLRMYAPAGVLFRQAVKDTDILGHYVPAGTDVMISAYASMRMEPWWERPNEFDPERFSEERREDKSHRYAWSPFGGGAHKCIGLYFGGMTVKAAMHQMLLRYTWSVPSDYEVPLTWGTGPTPADGLPVDLQRLPARNFAVSR